MAYGEIRGGIRRGEDPCPRGIFEVAGRAAPHLSRATTRVPKDPGATPRPPLPLLRYEAAWRGDPCSRSWWAACLPPWSYPSAGGHEGPLPTSAPLPPLRNQFRPVSTAHTAICVREVQLSLNI